MYVSTPSDSLLPRIVIPSFNHMQKRKKQSPPKQPITSHHISSSQLHPRILPIPIPPPGTHTTPSTPFTNLPNLPTTNPIKATTPRHPQKGARTTPYSPPTTLENSLIHKLPAMPPTVS